MKKILVFVIASFFILSLNGCASKEEAGALSGAAIGAVVGSSIGGGRGRAIAIMLGVAAGAHIGQTIGKYMDEQDRMRTSWAMEKNRTNEVTTWHNPDTGYDYTVKPTRTYDEDEGPCREFTVDAKVGGNTKQVYGTACRQADGSWKIIK